MLKSPSIVIFYWETNCRQSSINRIIDNVIIPQSRNNSGSCLTPPNPSSPEQLRSEPRTGLANKNTTTPRGAPMILRNVSKCFRIFTARPRISPNYSLSQYRLSGSTITSSDNDLASPFSAKERCVSLSTHHGLQAGICPTQLSYCRQSSPSEIPHCSGISLPSTTC